ncbi:serine/threonine-protein kinase Nek3 isoform X2 [Pseudonaja textilis]|uniref:serine/threonine-protein kinase Nek3 isoform X2 n=1 Tax=Pseudonaja textilis TaxID=8673 RepID=UPI000EA8ED02|nr:serine/threonine-protein kinase Nek3 isoform X2 [Pseudonaja textilis]
MENYNVLMELGEGSFGRVLLVQHKSTRQKYAMKEIRLPKSVFKIEKSWNESIILAKMNHPNIVMYADSFEADGHLHIVMEYCDGGDLLQKIKFQKGKLFPEDIILKWFAQMCLGVNYIHEKHILHRDIKSKNVFLTQNGKIKLGDFGSAVLLKSPMAYVCSYVGTPYYVPPEIWENMPYNNKSDIWSLGCVLYELCTLKHPFQAKSWKHLILKTCKGYYNPLPSHYSYELHYLIKQMFKMNPKYRPSASTILARKCLAKYIGQSSLPEKEDGTYAGSKNSKPEVISKNFSEMELKKTSVDEKEPQRQKWEKGRCSTVIKILENAPLLSSSIASKEDTGGCVRKYDENVKRKQWNKEPSQTLMNILDNADVSLAFKTYTIHKADDLLRGPLTGENSASDEPDGETFMEDAERLEPRSDEEDTDFEAEDDPDWISELQKMELKKELPIHNPVSVQKYC